MGISNTKKMSSHLDELCDEVKDDFVLNSHERHFMRKFPGRDHERERRRTKKMLKIYTKAIQGS